MVKLVLVTESHPQRLIGYFLKEKAEALYRIDSLVSKYGSEIVRNRIKEAYENPDVLGFDEFDREIAGIVGNLNKYAAYKLSSNQTLGEEANVVMKYNPSFVYYEGRNPRNEQVVKETANGVCMVFLDAGCFDYDMVKGMEARGVIENNPSYGMFQKDREEFWTKRIVENLPDDDECGLIAVGSSHIKPNEEGFGRLLEFLDKEDIHPEVISTDSAVSDRVEQLET